MATWLGETYMSSVYVYQLILKYLRTFVGTIIVYILIMHGSWIV